MTWLECSICKKEFHCTDLYEDKEGNLYCKSCKGDRRLRMCKDGKDHIKLGLLFLKRAEKEGMKLIGGALYETLKKRGLIKEAKK